MLHAKKVVLLGGCGWR